MGLRRAIHKISSICFHIYLTPPANLMKTTQLQIKNNSTLKSATVIFTNSSVAPSRALTANIKNSFNLKCRPESEAKTLPTLFVIPAAARNRITPVVNDLAAAAEAETQLQNLDRNSDTYVAVLDQAAHIHNALVSNSNQILVVAEKVAHVAAQCQLRAQETPTPSLVSIASGAARNDLDTFTAVEPLLEQVAAVQDSFYRHLGAEQAQALTQVRLSQATPSFIDEIPHFSENSVLLVKNFVNARMAKPQA